MKINLLPKQKGFLRKSALILVFTLVFVEILLITMLFTAVGPLVNAEGSRLPMVEVPLETCIGTAELYLYQGSPSQAINNNFDIRDGVVRDQLLVFTRRDLLESLVVEVNGVVTAHDEPPLHKTGDLDFHNTGGTGFWFRIINRKGSHGSIPPENSSALILNNQQELGLYWVCLTYTHPVLMT